MGFHWLQDNRQHLQVHIGQEYYNPEHTFLEMGNTSVNKDNMVLQYHLDDHNKPSFLGMEMGDSFQQNNRIW
jgi:hypothetical protein